MAVNTVDNVTSLRIKVFLQKRRERSLVQVGWDVQLVMNLSARNAGIRGTGDMRGWTWIRLILILHIT